MFLNKKKKHYLNKKQHGVKKNVYLCAINEKWI